MIYIKNQIQKIKKLMPQVKTNLHTCGQPFGPKTYHQASYSGSYIAINTTIVTLVQTKQTEDSIYVC